MIFLITALLIFTIIITYYQFVARYIKTSHYRVVYYVPTGRAVGIIIQYNGSNRFYYYINDFTERIKYLNESAAMQYLQSLRRLSENNGVSFENFEEYFSPNFFISKITPFCTFHEYSMARDLLKGYQSKILKPQELTKTVVIDDKF